MKDHYLNKGGRLMIFLQVFKCSLIRPWRADLEEETDEKILFLILLSLFPILTFNFDILILNDHEDDDDVFDLFLG